MKTNIGKNILDNLTTGMYSDSKVAYREYVQNACDQIDKAIGTGLISRNDAYIDIDINKERRYVSIKDNATGVCSDKFVASLGDIANSDKERGNDKGFRGIGRLCGLAYCKTLTFSTSYFGENIASVMVCNAERMREMLNDNKKYSIEEVWSEIVSFSTKEAKNEEHYFEVLLQDINNEDTELLDDKKVAEYLSFVAPVPYDSKFFLKDEIYSHAKLLNYSIDEYNIYINGAQLYKNYTASIKEQTSSGALKQIDDIETVQFKDFCVNGKLIAWMWYGISGFEKRIPECNVMKGLRLRCANIQIGSDNTLQKLFKEHRGNYYFIGEVFSVAKDLIPNSQRNYFNQNPSRFVMERELKRFFYDELHKLYYGANKIKNDCKKIEEHTKAVEEYNSKIKQNGFIDEDDRQRLKDDIDKKAKVANEAGKRLKKYEGINPDSAIGRVYRKITNNHNDMQSRVSVCTSEFAKNDKPYITQKFSKLNRDTRKVVSRIFVVITDTLDRNVAEDLIKKIEEELQK